MTRSSPINGGITPGIQLWLFGIRQMNLLVPLSADHFVAELHIYWVNRHGVNIIPTSYLNQDVRIIPFWIKQLQTFEHSFDSTITD